MLDDENPALTASSFAFARSFRSFVFLLSRGPFFIPYFAPNEAHLRSFFGMPSVVPGADITDRRVHTRKDGRIDFQRREVRKLHRIQRGEEKTPVVGDADENGRELGDDHEGRGLGGGPVVPSREGDLLL